MTRTSLSIGLSVIAVLLLLLGLSLAAQPSLAGSNDLIQHVYTDKAHYSPDDTVTVTVEIENNTGSQWSGTLSLDISHLESSEHTDSQSLTVSAGASTTKTFVWTTPATDFQGYFVEVSAGSTDSDATAIDVSSDWTRYPRYGFVYDFSQGRSQTDSEAAMDSLAQNYHINATQFYDWMWRHENVISETNGTVNDPYYDWAGNPISYSVIEDLVTAAHDDNVAAMPYFMIYAGLQGYEQVSGVNPEWGIYQDTNHSTQRRFDFGDDDANTNLWIFNPAITNWQNHLFRQYDDAILTADFDGIHLDQMGNYWGGPYYDYWGNSVDLGNNFSPLLNNAKEHVSALAYHNASKSGQDALTFNMVNGGADAWGVNDVTQNSDVDFLYSEIWENSTTYKEIYDYVREAREESGHKALVLAAYMNYYENLGTRYEAEDATLNSVATDTDHTGYTGSGFVDQFGDSGDSVEFSINVPEDGKYALVFRYANSTGSTNTRSVYVDGSDEAQIEFNDQADWDTWARDAYYVATLSAGSHTVTLTRDGDDSGFINLDSLTLGTFDENSVRLADAAFAASGAYHIEMGEGDQMLGHPYFPNNSKQMRSSLKAAMKDHYNFITAYENLLFDPDLQAGDGGTQWIDIAGESVSGDASADTIWYTTRRNDEYDVVNLVNLSGNDDEWRNEAVTPTTKTNLSVKYYLGADASVSGVYLASPDRDDGATSSLSYSTGSDSTGDYISFTVPTLEYWDMIYIDRSVTAPSNDRYEAENGILTAVSTNTNHSGYSGSGFVDQYDATNDSISFWVDVPADDDYYFRFRYANATGSTATRNVYVDGQYAGEVSFDSLANWDTWGDGILTTRLDAGLHQVTLFYGGGNSTAINLDYLQVKPAYVWNFDSKVDHLADGYYLTFKVGQEGYVHWGTNNWNNTTDTWFVPNGSSDDDHDYEATVGPFSGDTEINLTFAWDDDGDGSVDRWEGQDFSVGTNAPTDDYYQVEGVTGNNYSFAQFDAHGTLFDFMVPLGIWSGIKVDGSVGAQGAQININKSTAGVEVDGDYYWLNDASAWTYQQSYVTDTVTLKFTATHKTLPLRVVNTAFVPKGVSYPTDTSSNPIPGMLVQRFDVENTSGSSLDVNFLYYQDMNINGADAKDSVSYKSADDTLFFHDPGDSASGRTRTIDFGLAFDQSSSSNKIYQETEAAYLQKDLTIGAGSSADVDLLLVGEDAGSTGANLYSSAIKEAVSWFRSADLDALQATTNGYWGDLLAGATTFESPDARFNDAYKRGILTSYLYFDAEKGAMGAGSYNGAYFFSWPRDAVYGAVTMDKAGLHDVAENVYDWLWNIAERDTSSNDIGSDGVYHRFWYQKYTMDGVREWVNPQVDETAMIPWGAWYHYQMTGDSAFISSYEDLVREAADVSSTENPHECLNFDGTLNLIYAQNSWEDKWGYFLYSNANIAAGLRDAAAFMDVAGDTTWRNTFNSRYSNFVSGIENNLYDSTAGRYEHGRYVKKTGYCTNSGSEINHDISADISMLGLVTPFEIEPVTDTQVISTVQHLEPALTDFSETKMAYGGAVRYRADQEELYGSAYRNFGDTYYDGGPWMMPTDWLSEYYLAWAGTETGKTKVDTAQDYLDYVLDYTGNLGIGAEQIDENKKPDEFALETAWANIWESNGKIVDNLLAFVDYDYDAANDTLDVAPKIPSDWSYLGSDISLKDGTFYVKVTEGSSAHTVDLDNDTTSDVDVTVHVQTDAQPTSVTGTSLSWSYDSTTGRVTLYGTFTSGTSETITINH